MGIRWSSCEPINEFIKKQVPVAVAIPQFLADIDDLDTQLRARSASGFDMMKEQLNSSSAMIELGRFSFTLSAK